MHEVGIMQSTLDIAFEWTARQGADRIERLGMRVGALSGVVPDALQFAFEALKQGTPAETAELQVETIPTRLYCPTCKREFTTDDFYYACPECDSFDTEVRQGRELEVAYVELSSGKSEPASAAETNLSGNRTGP